MTLSPTKILSATEQIMRLHKMAQVSNDRDARRDEILSAFQELASDCGKGTSRYVKDIGWSAAAIAANDLHTAACQSAELRVGSLTHAGNEGAMIGSLVALAHLLGFTLYDAVPINSESARPDTEGHEIRAAE